MVKAGGGTRLALEPLAGLLVPAARPGHHLEGHAAAEGRLLRLVDDAHAAPADLAEQAVLAQEARRLDRGEAEGPRGTGSER